MMDEKTRQYGPNVAVRARSSRPLQPGWKALIWLASAAAGWAAVALLALLIL
jgi:hypothetical protein